MNQVTSIKQKTLPVASATGAMTVREAADALGVSPDKVYRSAKELFPDVFAVGKTAYLDEAQVTALKYNLRKTAEVMATPKTRLEKALLVQQALRLQQEMVEDLQNENAGIKAKAETDRPKVELYDRCMESGSLMSISTMAKKLEQPGLGPRNIFDFLAANGVLFRNSSGFWVPYQKHIDLGRFEVKQVVQPSLYTDGVRTRVYDATRVTQKGFAFVERLVSAAFQPGEKESA